MIYGIVEIYVVADKEVSTAVFDYTNLNSVFPNQVNWVSYAILAIAFVRYIK